MSLKLLDSAAIDDLLGRLDDPALVDKGALFVLGLEAIRNRSGGRWPLRQETVREFIERQFQKYFPPADHLLRLDDVHFLLVQPYESGFGAQARALKLLGDVLQYFLGTSAGSDVRLSRVTRLSSSGVETAIVEVSDADLTRMATMDWGETAPTIEASSPTDQAVSIRVAGPLISEIDAAKRTREVALRGDRSYEALFVTEPIWSIKQRAVVSYLLRPLVFELQADGLVEANPANASVRDLLRLDLLILSEAQRLFREHGADRPFVLHLPIHHAALGMATGRQTLVAALERLQPAASSSVITVLTGLDTGAPHSRIIALTSALAGRCRAIVALAPDLDCKIDFWRDSHLSGVAVDMSVLASSTERVSVRRIIDFAARFQGIAPALIAYSVPNTAILLAAWSAGFTHVGGGLIDKYSDGMLQPLRLSPIDLYRNRA